MWHSDIHPFIHPKQTSHDFSQYEKQNISSCPWVHHTISPTTYIIPMSSQGGRIFHQKKPLAHPFFSGLSEEPFEASNVEVQGQEPTPESTGEVGMFRICCWNLWRWKSEQFQKEKTVYYLNIPGVALFCCVSVFCFTLFFSHGFCFNVLFCPKKCIVSFPRKRFSPGGDEAGDRDRKPKDMLKDSIQSDDVCANFQLFRIWETAI